MPGILICLLFGFALQTPSLGASAEQTRRMDTISKAEDLLGDQYVPPVGLPLKFPGDNDLARAPQHVIYRHGVNYVVILTFASDGTLAQLKLTPEVLLHTNSWTQVPPTVELSTSDRSWFLQIAHTLSKLGKGEAPQAPIMFCFHSGKNHYCGGNLELASVGEYREDVHQNDSDLITRIVRETTILYKKTVAGVITDVSRAGTGETLIEIGANRYEISNAKNADSTLDKRLVTGGLVTIVTFGCTSYERVCQASLVSD